MRTPIIVSSLDELTTDTSIYPKAIVETKKGKNNKAKRVPSKGKAVDSKKGLLRT